MSSTLLYIYTDGASRGNPGDAAYAFVIKNENQEIIYRESEYMGITTNNDAEYKALLKAWEKLQTISTSEVICHFFSDSQLMVSQITGKFKINAPHIKEYVQKIKQLEKAVSHVEYTYIPRAQNKEADALCNQTLDSLSK